jgi:hypothetical protein
VIDDGEPTAAADDAAPTVEADLTSLTTDEVRRRTDAPLPRSLLEFLE